MTLISEILTRRVADRGALLPPLRNETVLLGSELGIDSLDLAVLVIELEERTGQDPFKNGFRPFTTVGELASLYAGT